MAQREIKFRAWDRSMGRYFGPGSITAFDSPNIVIYPNGQVFELDDDDTIIREVTDEVILEQYTGQKDNYWVEIYEGDRVVIFQDGDEAAKGYVVYEDYKFYVKTNDRFEYDYFEAVIGDGSYSFEVIGNIHEE